MDLGLTIKKIRKEKGLTQGEFATACGITQTYLSQIENNQKEPNLSTLKKLSDALGLPLPILFFLSMNEDDVRPNKRKAFNQINPAIKSLVSELFNL